MRVVFLGNDVWSVPALGSLASAPGLDVVLTVTNEPRPAGRGSSLTPTPVAQAARGIGTPLVETSGVRAGRGLGAVSAARPDVLVVVAYGQILPSEVLDFAPRGSINLHFSLLPRWRGAAPVQHTLLAGDSVTGVTTMLMDEGLDTGPILEQHTTPVLPDEDAGTLGARLADIGAKLLVHTVRSLDQVVPRPQSATEATSAPKLRPEDRVLDWSHGAGALVRRIKACAPDPAARTTFRGRPLNVISAEVVPASASPGSVVSVDERGVVVAAGRAGVLLLAVAPAGRRHMAARDWANGAHFEPDERLG